jgi:hypothetical protein
MILEGPAITRPTGGFGADPVPPAARPSSGGARRDARNMGLANYRRSPRGLALPVLPLRSEVLNLTLASQSTLGHDRPRARRNAGLRVPLVNES